VVGLAVWLPALGAEVPVGQPVRPLVHGATSPPTADLPRRAAEVVAAQFDTVAAVAEGCDPLVMRGVMPAGVWL
jgi:vancomycin aglycone glucosyltransferase